MIGMPRQKKSRLDKIKEKAAQFKLNWAPIRDMLDKSDKIIDLGVNLGLAYYGYAVNRHWTGAMSALMGYRLAKADSLVSSAAGISMLTALGILNLWQYTHPPPVGAKMIYG